MLIIYFGWSDNPLARLACRRLSTDETPVTQVGQAANAERIESSMAELAITQSKGN